MIRASAFRVSGHVIAKPGITLFSSSVRVAGDTPATPFMEV
jgi:hypothetical protein